MIWGILGGMLTNELQQGANSEDMAVINGVQRGVQDWQAKQEEEEARKAQRERMQDKNKELAAKAGSLRQSGTPGNPAIGQTQVVEGNAQRMAQNPQPPPQMPPPPPPQAQAGGPPPAMGAHAPEQDRYPGVPQQASTPPWMRRGVLYGGR